MIERRQGEARRLWPKSAKARDKGSASSRASKVFIWVFLVGLRGIEAITASGSAGGRLRACRRQAIG